MTPGLWCRSMVRLSSSVSVGPTIIGVCDRCTSVPLYILMLSTMVGSVLTVYHVTNRTITVTISNAHGYLHHRRVTVGFPDRTTFLRAPPYVVVSATSFTTFRYLFFSCF